MQKTDIISYFTAFQEFQHFGDNNYLVFFLFSLGNNYGGADTEKDNSGLSILHFSPIYELG
jgi:hypothetical protein